MLFWKLRLYVRGGNTSSAALMKENANDDADGERNVRTEDGKNFP